jgi:hypothetical protein
MARTLLINGREKIRPIILRTPGLEEEGKPAKRQAGIESEIRVARAAIGNMMKAIADVECGLVGQEIGDPESSRQDEVEPAGLFRDLPGEIGPKGASGEFGIGRIRSSTTKVYLIFGVKPTPWVTNGSWNWI